MLARTLFLSVLLVAALSSQTLFVTPGDGGSGATAYPYMLDPL